MEGLKIVLVVTLLNSWVDGACKVHDASWNRGQKPRITQPLRSEPEKVEIDWSSPIRNARCVDSYNIYVWKVGQPKERGQKIFVADKMTTKQTLIIDPCVDYNFAVEFTEKDWTHTDVKESATARYKTEAIPELLNDHPSNFRISYALNQATGTQNVDKVSISFNKNIIKHASCIKHIEVVGSIDNSAIGGSSQFGRATGFNQAIGGSSQTGGGRGQIGGSSQTGGRGQIGGSSQTGGRGQIGGSSQTGGRGQIGGSSQTGGRGQIGGSNYNPGGNIGSSTYQPGSNNIGGSSSYPGTGGSWTNNQHLMPDNYGYTSNYPNCPIGGSAQSNQYGRIWTYCYWSKPGFEQNHPQGDQNLARPPYDNNNNLNWGGSNNGGGGNNGLNWNNQRRNKRSPVTARPPHGGHNIHQQITPPFMGDIIDIEFRIQPCNGYKFDLKVVSPRNAVLGEVKNLRLAKMSEMQDFRPPPLSRVFRVDSSSGQITLDPSSGIPASCVGDFLHAVDNHLAQMKTNVQFHMNQESRANHDSYQWAMKLNNHKMEQLGALGCACQSTFLRINGTNKSAYQDLMGIYHFEGMFEGKPFYQQQLEPNPNQQAGVLDSGFNRRRTGFLYWDGSNNMWKVGPTLGGTNMLFRTSQFTKEQCPGDASNLRNWQYSGTLQWKNDARFAIECLQM